MTLPLERTRSVVYTKKFLRKLMDPKQSPRVPKAIRIEAYWLLRHYPWELYLDQSAKALPGIWGPIDNTDREELFNAKSNKKSKRPSKKSSSKRK